MTTHYLAVVSDTHSNSLFGLMRPGIQLPPADDMGSDWTPEATVTQKMVWDWWLEDLGRMKAIIKKSPVTVVHLGDVIHGNRFPGKEQVSHRVSDQIDIACDALSPLVLIPNVKAVRFVRGTGVHVLGHGSGEELVAGRLKRETGKNIGVAYHYDLEVAGVKVDMSHHGPHSGGRNWLKGNVLRLYTQSMMDGMLKDGHEPPGIMLRGHRHVYATEVVSRWARGKTWRTWAAVAPPYCTTDDYARKAAESPGHTWVGMMLFQIENRKVVDLHELVRVIDWRRKEVIRG